jgi:uncharacterized protein YcfJ
MKSRLMRTVITTSLLTALAVSAVAYYAAPRLLAANSADPNGATLQPAVYNGQPDVYTQAPANARLRRVAARPAVYNDGTYAQRDSYGEPVRHHRSTAKSVAIVAGSAGAGAAIGALAHGGRGAAIGAVAGGLGGFIYDRMTHNK